MVTEIKWHGHFFHMKNLDRFTFKGYVFIGPIQKLYGITKVQRQLLEPVKSDLIPRTLIIKNTSKS